MHHLVCLHYSKCKRVTAYILLFIQLFSPLFLVISSVARASAQELSAVDRQMLETVNGIHSLTELSSSSSHTPGAIQQPTLFKGSSFYSSQQNNGRAPQPSVHNSQLPLLGIDEEHDSPMDAPTRFAQGASQAGGLLSSENTLDSSIDYARSVGVGLLNQQVDDWLNQLGKARVSFGSNKTGDADLLVPVFDNLNNILFTQAGIRANEDRATTNAGIGYRQYQEGWMWGLNSFYDYDLTGSNSRYGVGGELWADYIKLAANGYFRITDWHQSTLSAMRDYDERPANGFDIRTEGYLPSYPQLGAYAKYEQYVGSGIDLGTGTSPSDLKSDPSATTLGVSYTPIPLLTFKGQTSRGDSHDSQIGMELTYRLGVSLSHQLDADKVDLMRSLAGSRYDFVDRNYNIVMQYRKQELLAISLPERLDGEAAQTLPVVVTVNKAKYGLKSTAWSAPEFIAAGGNIQVTSPTTANLTLPAYLFTARSNAPQAYRVYAVGTDGEGNQSNTAMMWVNVKPSQEAITQLTLTSVISSVKANNSDSYAVVVLVQNEKQEVLSNKQITFSVSGFKKNNNITLSDSDGHSGNTLTVITDNEGHATISIKGKIAGQGNLIATMKNGNSRSAPLTFVADSTTAQVSTLVLTKNKAVANGQATNIALATVIDQFDNPVEAFALTASASNGASVVTPSQSTNSEGQITVPFNNTTAGDSTLTVNGSGTSKTVVAQFVGDISTATISSLVVNKDESVANGQDSNILTVTVIDGNNNLVSNAPVAIIVPGSARYTTQPTNGLTDSHGQLNVMITNTKAGTDNYTAAINQSRETKALTFKADQTTATILELNLTIVTDNQVADGEEKNQLKALVTDAQGNVVPNVDVVFTSNNGGSPITDTVTTNIAGEAMFDVTNTHAGITKVTAAINGTKVNKNVTFKVGSIVQANSTIAVDKATYVAGTPIKVTVTLKDAQGNLAVGQSSALTPTTVMVANTTAGSRWTDNGNGTYSATYTANTVGTGLKATLKLTGASSSASSVAYGITVGGVAQGNSTIAVDNTTYVAGTLISVTVALKDGQGNPVAGQSRALTATTVTVGQTNSGSRWVDNGDGTYSATYTANTVGTGLKATLKLAGASSSASSTNYSITVGSPAQGNSTIAVDNTTYVAGIPIKVTVVLRDGQGNPVAGQSSALTTSTVTVANTNSGSRWTDNGDGTYSATYTANTTDTGLKAILTLAGASSSASSAAYSITAGSAVQGNSTITVNNTTYVAGTPISVTVTLKDAQGNLAAGQSSALTASTVTVANTTESSKWADNGDGTYSATYTAKNVGTGLKATLKLAGASGSTSSTTYSITVGSPAQGNSIIAVDKATYVAGTPIKVTVTLKDAQGNLAVGQSSALTTSTVTVANTTAGSRWTDNGNGTYSATYTADTVGTGLKATLRLTGASSSALSAAYGITAGLAAQDNSTIAVDNTTYVAGTPISVTVTLKDGQGNPATGQSSALTATTVTVANTTSGSRWVDNGDGTYSATYTADTVGTGLKATLKLAGASSSSSSAAYSITAGSAVQGNSTIAVDNSTYVAGTPISVTVTLKDAEGNLAAGQSSVLNDSTVMVANATSGSRWTDNGDGTYSAAYTANTTGTGLKATLKLTGASSTSSSTAYSITVGSAAQGNSTIAVDNTTYMAGTSIKVIVTLKDAQGNLAAGQSSALTASTVMVDNTSSGSRWTDNRDGTYSATYTANTTGAGLKAILKLTGASSSASSAAYSITAGSAVQGNSTIAVDNSTYVAGTPISVTVTLKDAQGNLAAGQSSALTASTVTVANTTEGSNWADNGDGTYSATYTANTVGTGLKATLKLAGASGSTASTTYSITVGSPAQGNSIIAVDKVTYVAGTTIKVTVTLKDGQSNPVAGQSSVLNDSTVTVANAASGSSWTDNRNGTYSATYTANTAGTDLQATLTLAGQSSSALSTAYAITAGNVVQGNSIIAVDNTTYVAGTLISVTVTLKDAQGNSVAGKSSALTTTTVTVANTTSGSRWTDNGDGTYSATYTANTAGTGLKATLKLAGASSSVSSVDYSITAGDPNGATSSLSIDKSRIVANNNSTGTDIATLSLTVRDGLNNPISDLEGNIQFVVLDNNGDEVSSGIAVSSVSAVAGTEGGYTANVYGNMPDNYTIKVKVKGSYLGSLQAELVLYTYVFELNEQEKKIVVTGKFQFTMTTKQSDTGTVENVMSDITWSSSNTSIATIASTGIAKGVNEGSSVIKAQGTYNGISFSPSATLIVRPYTLSPIYGQQQSSDTQGSYIIEPPSYALASRCGGIVDAIGTKESLTGGSGGSLTNINNITNVKSITVSSGNWSGDRSGKTITKVVFKYINGSTVTCGKGENSPNPQTYDIPSNHVLQGVNVGGGRYIHSIQFISLSTL